MTGITDKNSSGTTLVSYGYTYDAAGLLSQETQTWDSGADTDTLSYTYTNNDQLTARDPHRTTRSPTRASATTPTATETGTGYTTSTGNEQTASPGYNYTYDADGNMITSTQTSTGDVWTYTYNFRNLMTGAVEKNSGGTVLARRRTRTTHLTTGSAWMKMGRRPGRSMTARRRSWTSTGRAPWKRGI